MAIILIITGTHPTMEPRIALSLKLRAHVLRRIPAARGLPAGSALCPIGAQHAASGRCVATIEAQKRPVEHGPGIGKPWRRIFSLVE